MLLGILLPLTHEMPQLQQSGCLFGSAWALGQRHCDGPLDCNAARRSIDLSVEVQRLGSIELLQWYLMLCNCRYFLSSGGDLALFVVS